MKTIEHSLIIDDDNILTTLVKLLINKHEYYQTCHAFDHGQAAIDHLKKLLNSGQPLPDLILLDINMPVMDGWDFMAEFRKQQGLNSIPVFILTSSIDPADIFKAEKYAEIKGYIQKPLTLDKLSSIHSEITGPVIDDNKS